MKLFSKVFLFTLLIMTFALAVFGYLLISQSFSHAITRHVDQARVEHQMIKSTLLQEIADASQQGQISDGLLSIVASQAMKNVPLEMDVFIYEGENEKNTLVSKNTNFSRSPPLAPSQLDVTAKIYQVYGNYRLEVVSGFAVSNRSISLHTMQDISAPFSDKSKMVQTYIVTYIALIFVSMIALYILYDILTRPIEKLSETTYRIARGNFSVRAEVSSQDELGQLARNFNRMARMMEEKIDEMQEETRKKDDFVASFAHEIKTPLTSVIGYADMLYQREHSKEQVKDYAEYILNEGMRLEALSFKLMDLIILSRKDFILEELRIDEFFADIFISVTPLLDKNNVKMEIAIDALYVRAEADLLKTVILNLIDNAVKADAKNIRIFGEIAGMNYKISVQDDGKGIPKADLPYVQEAFYMVDKARARSQHGAGIGLALASEIAKVHRTRIIIESEEGVGTTISFRLRMIRSAS
ncbi:MAG: ATP-binding protein [Christensenellaceae bacterium]